ncbi:histidine phosphatase family protein [Frankia sp. R82]|uniref:histidine phosphatase family protein n=1 Tax=Frankia sp. R82 TaxID=2950553 RepID=UPI002043A393|nr:histidine phosphatase family protein [Frankia sp. R82]MCM3883125.1 histidine phosphatase family protein [Frankia sp. R82]
MTPDELDRLVAYLERGAVVFATRSIVEDALDPARPGHPGIGYLTDGQWLWTTETLYYLQQHAIPPDPDFVAYLRDRNYAYVAPSQEQIAAIGRALLAPAIMPAADGAAGEDHRPGSRLLAQNSVRLVLWRHGESIANVARVFQGHGDGPLSPAGRAQAQNAAERLVRLRPALIITSDLRRARDTADALSTRTGVPLQVDARLREADLGAWEGRTRSDIAARFPDEFARWQDGDDIARGGGERPGQVADRALAALADHITGLPAGSTVVVASHAGTILAVTGRLLGLTVSDWRQHGPVDNAAWIILERTPTGWERHMDPTGL